MRMKASDELTMPGSRVRETHAATVLSIVGAERAVPVVTRGTGFAMRGPFGWRTVAARFARGDRDARSLSDHTQGGSGAPVEINIAECGDDVPRRTYLALVGGAAHEAFHRLYSQQGALSAAVIAAALAPVMSNRSVDWTKRAKLVLDLQNVCEDIAIERLGCAEFPGVRTKMADLADYIVRMESDAREKAGNPPATVVDTVFIAWRDLGLGYNTTTIQDNLDRLARECPEGLAMLRPGGALHGAFLRSVPDVSTSEARERVKRDLLEGSSLRLALEAVVALESEGGTPPGQSDSKGDSEGDSKGDSKGDSEGDSKGDSEGDSEGDSKGDSKGDSEGDSKGGAGGGEGTSSQTAKDFLDGHSEKGKGTLDSNSALEAGIKSEQPEPPRDYASPMPYRPFSTSSDEVVNVRARPENASSFANIAREVRRGTSYLRTRLAVMFRALENSGTEHGVRKGSALSPRMLVDSYCEMRSGEMPTRAYMDRTPQLDMSVAAALVIDESSSMKGKLRETCAIAYTLLDALDSIGAKSMALGFRSKRSETPYYGQDYSSMRQCHRTDAMYYDVFKTWSESFKTAAPKLREIRAQGGTPMADGIEFALQELSRRKEGHRLLFVLTDGEPESSHGRVIPTQLRRAAEAGVLVIGVGLGRGSEEVKTRFPDHVYSDKLDDLPAALVRKLDELVRTRAAGAKRGRTVKAA